MINLKGTIVEQGLRISMIEMLINKYSHKEFVFKGNLIWNAFRDNPQVISIEKMKDLNISEKEHIYFYLEREKELYRTTFDNVYEYLRLLEPWEDIDAYIFTENMDWLVAVTHEDIILTLGL